MQTQFEVHRYVISWVSADPNYDYVYRLVPSITLFESASETDNSGAVAFLQFPRDDKVRGASYDSQRNNFYLDYPLSFASEVVHLVERGERGIPLTLVYKDEDGRQWAELRTQPQLLTYTCDKK